MPSQTFSNDSDVGSLIAGRALPPQNAQVPGAISPANAAANVADMRKILENLFRQLAEGCTSAADAVQHGHIADFSRQIPLLVDFAKVGKPFLSQDFITSAVEAIEFFEEAAGKTYTVNVPTSVCAMSEHLLGHHHCRVVVPHPLRHYSWTIGLTQDDIDGGQYYTGRVLTIHHETAVMGHVTRWNGSGTGLREPFVVPVEALTPWWD